MMRPERTDPRPRERVGGGAVGRVMAGLAALITYGCQPDLPPCDDAIARRVVYLDAPSDVASDDGIPMFEGQALMYQSCGGNAFCHSQRAKGEYRVGAPYAVRFDVSPPCIGAACPTASKALNRFDRGMRDVRSEAERYYAFVTSGRMPPGHMGRRIRERLGELRRLPTDPNDLSTGELVPDLSTAEGQRVLGTWLACGAPAVRTVLDPDANHAPGDTCALQTSDDEACVTRWAQPTVTFTLCPSTGAPTYDELYDRLLRPRCVDGCHGSESPNQSTPRFSDAQTTYDVLLDATVDYPLVVIRPDMTGSATESHLVHHLEGLFGYLVMPNDMVSPLLPPEVLSAVRAWIDAGAQRDCP